MKDKLTNWWNRQQKLAREISEDISHYGRGLVQKVKGLAAGGEQKAPPKRSRKPARADNQRRLSLEVTAQMEQAVTRAYYQEGGIRYFGDNLVRFVKVVLPQERDLQTLWAAGYNGCIAPMLWQLEKLEEELETIRTSRDVEIPKFENELLRTIRLFARMVTERKLHCAEGWTGEAYAEELTDFVWNLQRQLLDVYKLS